ncbi:zona pellucida sperm-binding protein 4-like [Hyperolius riggenbachi]|uniref:zona pellucida sperm-binding protein 4-like n=1 Tax=Hyperolius riggenbachi TaxID=752182 RepID=UPI0035A3A868
MELHQERKIAERIIVGFLTAYPQTPADYQDNAHRLKNDSSCGLQVGKNKDGSLVATVALGGCYIREEDDYYVATLIADYTVEGEEYHQKKDFRCPNGPAKDAPSASDCAAIQRSDRLPCGNSSVSRDVCEGLGCCFSNDPSLPCYFGNKVTAQCTDDSKFVVAISKDVTLPSLILDSAHVVNMDTTSCPALTVSTTSSFVMFQFPSFCGGSQVSGDTVIYENTIEATRDIKTWGGVFITRDSTMRLTVRCSYSRTGVAPLKVEVFTLPPPLPVSTSGPLSLEMRIAKDDQYSSYYVDADYPITRVLREPVDLEVRILRRTDPNLVLILNDCWATPSPDAAQLIQWPILQKSCPYNGETQKYLTLLSPLGAASPAIPYPNHYKRFIVSTFVFVDQRTQSSPLSGQVYFHCSASVCVQSAAQSCVTTCSQRKKREIEPLEEEIMVEEMVVSSGPVNFHTEISSKLEVSFENESPIEELGSFEMLNETDEPSGFIGAEDNLDGDITDVGKIKRGGGPDPNATLLMWLRGAAIGAGIMAVAVTIFGLRSCHKRQNATLHTVNI